MIAEKTGKHEARTIGRRATVGDYVRVDGWKMGELLVEGMPGFCEYYLPTGYSAGITQVAVNITVTGRTEQRDGYRCRITFIKEDEPNESCGGWIRFKG